MIPPAPGAAATVGSRPGAAYWSLGVTCITLALAYGVWYAYSVFLVALLREFGWSRSVLAGAFSLFALVAGAVNPVPGPSSSATCARRRSTCIRPRSSSNTG